MGGFPGEILKRQVFPADINAYTIPDCINLMAKCRKTLLTGLTDG